MLNRNGTVLIARRAMRLAGRNFLPGDLYDQDEVKPRAQTHRLLVEQKKVVPLTRDSYRTALRSRGDGQAVGRGFTEALLRELGILTDEETTDSIKPATAGPWIAPDDALEFEGFLILPMKQGNFTRFEVRDADGLVMREKRFNKLEAAQTWIADMRAVGQSDLDKDPTLDPEPVIEPAASTDAPASDTSGEPVVDSTVVEEGQGNGGDIQSGASEPGGPNPATPG